jgi:hypothetical protein
MLLLLSLVQAGLFMVDEFFCHRRRRLGRWERLGHPVDSLSISLPLFVAAFAKPEPEMVLLFVGLAVVSCLLVAKDEWVHARECSGTESWIHALMFMVHPTIFFAAGAAWWLDLAPLMRAVMPLLALTVAVYQFVYWNLIHDNQSQ